MSDALNIARNGPVVTLTLARPDEGNPITLDLAQELAAAYQAINDDETVLAVILTGSGDFSLGEPEEEPSPVGGDLGAMPHRMLGEAVEGLARLRPPVVAAIAGRCEGAGLELALAADLRVCADDATFAMPQIARGDMPHWGGTQRLPRTIARGAALELILLAEPVSAAEAFRLGLVNRTVPAGELQQAAQAWAVSIAEKAPIATRYIREAIIKGMDLPLFEGTRLEGDLYFINQTTEDRTEGVRSFLEKRPSVFRGR
ncbi:MAG: enoyl-CoA hydratase-related protein [Chloroflexi bacterium]|nr:enoyl-CoA hydratase-related protein [Chloroflexota bacterium]